MPSSFFTQKLGFRLGEDTSLGEGRRWVTVCPPGPGGTGLLLAKAASPNQQAGVGAQTGGRVFLFLRSDDFLARSCGISPKRRQIRERPRKKAYGMVAVFQDICGNLRELIGPG